MSRTCNDVDFVEGKLASDSMLRSQGKNINFFIVIVYAITNRLNCDAKIV